MSIQQTVLRVQTNIPGNITITGTTSLSVSDYTGVTYSGSGTTVSPYTGTTPASNSFIEVQAVGDGILTYNFSGNTQSLTTQFLQVLVLHPGQTDYKIVFQSWSLVNADSFKIKSGDKIKFFVYSTSGTSTFSIYFVGDVSSIITTPNTYQFLDLFDDIPITINKSFAEIQDISKRNSDFSIGVRLPGSKKNNRFFENFFNVDNQSLYFDATKKVQCQVLIDDESYFTGYLKLNRINVLNSQVEYEITLYSNVGDLYGKIGNNLLIDLDFRDVDYYFNHTFDQLNCIANWRYETLKTDQEVPSKYFYPVFHNGYNYQVSGNTSSVDLTGTTSGTSLYTTTVLGSWANYSAATSSGVTENRINSPLTGIRDYQLKPAMNIYSLMKLLFKTYGYSIKSDFMSTPWFRLLYLYGTFSDDSSTLSTRVPGAEVFGADLVDVNYLISGTTVTLQVLKQGTAIPALCETDITVTVRIFYFLTSSFQNVNVVIPAQTFSVNYTAPANTGFVSFTSSVGVVYKVLSYPFSTSEQTITIRDGDYLDFSSLLDNTIKQIDFLQSVAKKFNLLFIPDKEVPNQIIVEPYDFYIGTGNIYDWSDKLSWDKGFSVEPLNNFVESEIILTEDDGSDQVNIDFFESNSRRRYGENRVTNPTEFKSEKKEIKTTFSPMIVRKWNPNNNTGITSNAVGIPLGVNYIEQSQEITSGNNSTIDFIYKGVKSKPKLLFLNGNFSPFLDTYTEVINLTGVTTSQFRVMNSNSTGSTGSLVVPVISPTVPLGNPDSNKINNDSLSILFNTEETTSIAGDSVTILSTQTRQNSYNQFYENRIINSFDKNSRMLSGFFNIGLYDIKNLEANDLIKVNNQYFTWNKVENYNLSNPELTKVELIQVNNSPRQYPTRYFQYEYCNDTGSTIYKFKTNFVGEDSFVNTFYYYSILYDYFVGVLGGNVSGVTTSVPYTGTSYLPLTITEVSESTYNSSGTLYTSDPYRYYFLEDVEEFPSGTVYSRTNMVYMVNVGQSKAILNVFTDCSDLTTKASAIGVDIAGFSSSLTYSSGVTINVTSAGWIRYDNSFGSTETYFNTGSRVIPGCVDCNSIRFAYPFFPLGNWTLTNCGTPCP